jgi:hypothetical protein
VMDCLIDPGVSKLHQESLRATFLFKSWRRRVMDPTIYHRYERDGNGPVRAAGLGFHALRANVLQFDGRIGVGPPKLSTRFVFYVQEDTNLVKVNDILDSISTIEAPKKASQGPNLFYVDIATSGLRNNLRIEGDGLESVHNQLVHPVLYRHFYVSPDEITAKNVLIRESIEVEKGSVESDT